MCQQEGPEAFKGGLFKKVLRDQLTLPPRGNKELVFQTRMQPSLERSVHMDQSEGTHGPSTQVSQQGRVACHCSQHHHKLFPYQCRWVPKTGPEQGCAKCPHRQPPGSLQGHPGGSVSCSVQGEVGRRAPMGLL